MRPVDNEERLSEKWISAMMLAKVLEVRLGLSVFLFVPK